MGDVTAAAKAAFAVATAWTPLPAAAQTAWAAATARWTPFEIYFGGMVLVSSVVFWGMSLLYLVVDTFQWPRALLKYKVQPGKHQPLEPALLRKAFVRVAFNWLLINIPLAWFGYGVYTAVSGPVVRPLPSGAEILLHLVGCVAVEEVLFYYSHRLFHMPLFYQHVHKIHHEWRAPIAMTAVYAHPLEHLLSNLTPVLAGPHVVGAHIVTTWLWIAIALFSTVSSHSGYHLPFMPSPESHDYHHAVFNNNYGATGILDWLHGTDKDFRRSLQKKRNLVLLTTQSARELVPDTYAAAAATSAAADAAAAYVGDGAKTKAA